MSAIRFIEMDLYDSLPKEYRELVQEYNEIYTVHGNYSSDISAKDTRIRLEVLREFLQEHTLAKTKKQLDILRTSFYFENGY